MFNGFNISDISECYFGSQGIAEIYLGMTKLWPKGSHDYSSDYLTFEALTDNTTFSFSVNNIQYSLDDGSTWTTLTAGSSTPSLNTGDKILWKQTGLVPGTSYPNSGIGTFSATGNFDVYGNIMSLYYGDNFIGQISLSGKDEAFCNLFNGNTKLVDVENLILPATTLANYCYQNMFKDCTSLITAPELPATTLANGCYSAMFMNCTSLTTAPKILSATTLTDGCYFMMFYGCTSLTTALELPATTLAYMCYYGMFAGCISLTTAPIILPATTLAIMCYGGMFKGCTLLTTAPELPATTLANDCYAEMFYNCSSLNYIKCLATSGFDASNCLSNWVYNVSASGTFVKKSSATWPIGTSGIPTGWTIDPPITNYVSLSDVTIPVDFDGLQIYDNSVGQDTNQYCEISMTLYNTNGDVIDNRYKMTIKRESSASQQSKLFIWSETGAWSNNFYLGNNSQTGNHVIRYSDVESDLVSWDSNHWGTINFSYLMQLINNEMQYSTTAAYFRITSIQSGVVKSHFKIEPLMGPDYSQDYFTIEAINSATIEYYTNSDPYESLIYYSKNNGSTWTEVTADVSGVTLTVLSPGEKILIKSYSSYFDPDNDRENNYYSYFSSNGNFKVYGNVMSLLYGDNFVNKYSLSYINIFSKLFLNCTNLIDAENLILPATTLSLGCYKDLFRNCTNMVKGPKVLPANSAKGYFEMFYNCSSLVKSPEILATEMDDLCASLMFYNCSSLNYIKCLVTTMETGETFLSTENWVSGVSATGTFVKSSSAAQWTRGINGIPSGWTVQNA